MMNYINAFLFMFLVPAVSLITLLSSCGRYASFSYETTQCTVVRTDNGATISCPDGSVVNVADGTNGTNGTDGVDGLDGADSIIEVIDPCGDGPGVDEVILRLNDGRLLAWYQGKGLSVLDPGSYVTTDEQKCRFLVGEDLRVTEI